MPQAFLEFSAWMALKWFRRCGRGPSHAARGPAGPNLKILFFKRTSVALLADRSVNPFQDDVEKLV